MNQKKILLKGSLGWAISWTSLFLLVMMELAWQMQVMSLHSKNRLRQTLTKTTMEKRKRLTYCRESAICQEKPLPAVALTTNQKKCSILTGERMALVTTLVEQRNDDRTPWLQLFLCLNFKTLGDIFFCKLV